MSESHEHRLTEAERELRRLNQRLRKVERYIDATTRLSQNLEKATALHATALFGDGSPEKAGLLARTSAIEAAGKRVWAILAAVASALVSLAGAAASWTKH